MLEGGGNSITTEIANNLGSVLPPRVVYLLAAALTLFLLTLVINTLAATRDQPVPLGRRHRGGLTAHDREPRVSRRRR